MFGANYVKGDVISEPDGEQITFLIAYDFFSLNYHMHFLYFLANWCQKEQKYM